MWKFWPRQASRCKDIFTLSLCLELKRWTDFQLIVSFTTYIRKPRPHFATPSFSFLGGRNGWNFGAFLPLLYPRTVNPLWCLVDTFWRKFFNYLCHSCAFYLFILAGSVAGAGHTVFPTWAGHSALHPSCTPTWPLYGTPIKEYSMFPWCKWHKMNPAAWFVFSEPFSVRPQESPCFLGCTRLSSNLAQTAQQHLTFS